MLRPRTAPQLASSQQEPGDKEKKLAWPIEGQEVSLCVAPLGIYSQLAIISRHLVTLGEVAKAIAQECVCWNKRVKSLRAASTLLV